MASTTIQNVVVQDNLQILGRVVNGENGEIIPYCNIEVINSLNGTSTNELGEFVLNIETLPTTLVFSHLNYERKVVEVTNQNNLNIQLTPLVNSLREVILSVNKKDQYAFNLAENAFYRTRKLSNTKRYGRAFYRQKSNNGDDYTEFSEIMYDVVYTADGIENWEILEGRYALKREKVNNSNYTLLSRVLKVLQPDTDDLIFPLRFDIEKYYDIRVLDVLNSERGNIAVLWFKPLEDVNVPILDAEVYINTKTHEVLKVVGTVTNDNLEFIQFKEENTHIQNYQLTYEMVFKENEKDLLLDYIKMDHSFDYYRDGSFLTHVTSTSNLLLYEHYSPTNKRSIRSSFRNNRSDWEALNKVGYNEKFWANNPIVKRTPVEDEVIASFEQNNAFESIFLNSKEQIAFMQDNLMGDLFIEEFDKSIRAYNNGNPTEKVYLHTDKDVFIAGEEVWYSAYAVLGSYHHPSEASGVIHVDLVDVNSNKVVSQTQGLKLGKGQGTIALSKELPPGKYQLRAYTNWMRNFNHDYFFNKEIEVLNSNAEVTPTQNIEEKIDLQFFAEGGNPVAGLNGKIAFKAIGEDGLSRKVKGRITDANGNTVVSFRSIFNGMGFFNLTPIAGKKYAAILDDGTSYPLPIINNNGYTMLADNLDDRNIKVKIQVSDSLRFKPFYIIGTIHNEKYYQGRFEFGREAVMNLEIPKTKLPSGVLTLTLFDDEMRPWCERALFVNNKEELVIRADFNKTEFIEREKLELNVHVMDPYGAPLSTNVSLAITDAEKVKKNDFGANILTHFLLQSDVNGYVENPAFYFNDNKRSTKAKLDLVMLTNGWRKYNWQEVKNWDSSNTNEFSFAKGFSVFGVAMNTENIALNDFELKMIAKSDEKFNVYSTRTNRDGSFAFEGIEHLGDVELAFNAYTYDGEPVDTKIILKDNSDEVISSETVNRLIISNNTTQEDIDDSFIDYFLLNEDVQVLDEIVVTGRNANVKISEPAVASSLYGLEADHIVNASERRGGNVLFHLNDIPGVRLDMSRKQIYLRGNAHGPLWIVDGFRLAAEGEDRTGMLSDDDVPLLSSAGNRWNIPRSIQNLDISNVERIEVIMNAAKAAVYGPDGRYGVIIFYTKDGSVKPDNSFTSKYSVNGFSGFKEFYSPKYDVALKEHEKPDYRTTLYWNPSTKTDKNGNATIIFYNSDIGKSLEVDIQGLSTNGTPGAFLKTFN